MPQDQLLTYIKTQLASGFSKETIIQTLLSSGYQQTAIDQAFATLASSPLSTQSAPNPTPQPLVVETPNAQPIPEQLAVTPSPQPETKQSRFFTKKRLLFILIPFIILLILGIAVFYFVTNSPTYVLNQAFEKTKTIKTLSYNATMKASFDFSFPSFGSSFDASPSSQLGYSDDFTQGELAKPDEKSKFVLTVNMKGSSDFNNKPKHSYIGEVSVGDGDLNSLGGALELRTLDDNIYLRIAKFPNFGLFETASITNKWIKFEGEDLQTSYLTRVSEPKKKQELTGEEIQKLQDMVKKANVITVAQTLSAETIENQPSHHYQLAINKKNLENFLNDASVILAKSDDQKNYYKDMKGYVAKMDFKKSEIWIAKKEKYITRVLMEIAGNKTEYGDVSFSADIKMKDMNKPVTIIAPLDAKSFTEIYQSSFDMYPGMSSESASLSQPNATPTPIIVPYGTVLGDKTKPEKETNPKNTIKPLNPAEKLVTLFLFQLVKSNTR